MDGLCCCGCKEKTKISRYANPGRNQKAGEPRRFVKGHENRKFPVQYVVDKNTGCWIWKWSIDKKGYSSWNENGKTKAAYVIFYERVKGKVKKGYELDHLCRNRLCVNPEHLEEVTHTENMRRSPVVTRISNEIIKEIMSLKGKKLQKDVALKYGVHPGYVSDLWLGKWRKDITCEK